MDFLIWGKKWKSILDLVPRMFGISVGQMQWFARQLTKYIDNLDLVGVQKVKWDKESADIMYTHTNVYKI